MSSLLASSIASANLTPVPERGCGGLEWDATNATTINVYRDSGEYIESIPGNRVVWSAPESGSYFLVGADDGDWRDWTRSPSVFVDTSESNGCIDPNLLVENFEFNVVSPIAIEITWRLTEPGDRLFSHVEVMQSIDGQPGNTTTLATGSRFTAENLLPETDYTFATVIVDLYGRSGDSVSIYEHRTPAGEPGQGDQALPPLGLRADVYSGTALELFWQNNSDFIYGESGYTVWQDDVEIASGLNGTSFFIDRLSPGTAYSLSVTTSRGNSQRSEPASVLATTTGTTQTGTSTPSSINVAAGTISWPLDGWYQVQDATTYQSLCEGGSSCSVPAGRYIVINHSTGARQTVLVN